MPTEHFKLMATIDFLERLKGGWKRRGRIADIGKTLDLMTEGHLFAGSNLQDGLDFYRGRLLRNKKPFTNLKELIHKNASDVTDFGRCNAPNQAVLYASSNLETVLSELSAQVDEWVQIIKIRKKDGETIKCTVVGDIDHVRRHGRSSLGGDGFISAIRQHLDSLSEIERFRLNITDAFVADEFRSPARYSSDYKVTSTVSSFIFALGYDAFYYPSVEHLGGWNIAISEEAFKRGFEVLESQVIEIFDSPGYGFFRFQKNYQSQKIESGNIELSGVTALHAYPTFDNFLWIFLCRHSSGTVLFQALKKAEGEFVRQNEPPMENQEDVDSQTTELTINGSFPLAHDKDFQSLSQFISASTDSWDFLICEVIPNTQADEVQLRLKEFVEQVKLGNTTFSMFDRQGNAKIPVFGSPAHKTAG